MNVLGLFKKIHFKIFTVSISQQLFKKKKPQPSGIQITWINITTCFRKTHVLNIKIYGKILNTFWLLYDCHSLKLKPRTHFVAVMLPRDMLSMSHTLNCFKFSIRLLKTKLKETDNRDNKLKTDVLYCRQSQLSIVRNNKPSTLYGKSLVCNKLFLCE